MKADKRTMTRAYPLIRFYPLPSHPLPPCPFPDGFGGTPHVTGTSEVPVTCDNSCCNSSSIRACRS